MKWIAKNVRCEPNVLLGSSRQIAKLGGNEQTEFQSVKWKPISEPELLDKVNSDWERMTPPERHFWETIRIDPQKWQCSPWGDEGQGFWVVAVLGASVVWYNDIENGFNCSRYQNFGEFSDYWCNQDGLDHMVKALKGNLDYGHQDLWQAGPPHSQQ